jgi:hypothetical protein
MDVRKLQIFDRYGIKVYGQMNYTDQWKGQSDNGDELPVQPIIMLWNLITVNPNWLDLSNQRKIVI